MSVPDIPIHATEKPLFLSKSRSLIFIASYGALSNQICAKVAGLKITYIIDVIKFRIIYRYYEYRAPGRDKKLFCMHY